MADLLMGETWPGGCQDVEALDIVNELAPKLTSRVVELLSLPAELVDSIASYLTPRELARLSMTCRRLCGHALHDMHWRRHVLENLPGNQISSPYPCQSWRHLYVAHHEHWFLTKHKVWFSDHLLTGQVAIARYDPRRGCIEVYQLIAVRTQDGTLPWIGHPEVHIQLFDPNVKLHLDRPILQFNPDSWANLMQLPTSPGATPVRRFFGEESIRLTHGSDPRSSTFALARPMSEQEVSEYMSDEFPHGHVWPPPIIPASHRVMGVPNDMSSQVPLEAAKAKLVARCKSSEASTLAFRIRQWMQMAIGFRYGEEVSTYATLDPSLYTPTAERPWRGIWIGDYSIHGSEFVLITQPDSTREPLMKGRNESDEEFKARFMSERVYRDKLEAIKLTGDPHVPRGEISFIADDLGARGFIQVADDPAFCGSRIVRSRGHIAGPGFIADSYTPSQLILIGPNRIAQYWEEYQHVSYFERVNIDDYLTVS
ncbi:hypothetical protein GGR50DRAFT_672462 [Xylaria sp. CBS 124048]|nr:hypothetical protein GGR50DRAFT_672462 [Xylaria sp. CBS 124048]